MLRYPMMTGMDYPRLDAADLVDVVADAAAILALPPERRAGVRVLMTSTSLGCSASIVEALPNLRFIVSQGAGRDKFDLPSIDARGIRLRNVGEALTEDVADLAMSLVQMSSRRLVQADRFARSGDWKEKRYEPGLSLVDATIGIAGLSGRIGRAIARRAEASCMKVAGLDRPSNVGLSAALYPDMLALAEASDVLVLAVPGTPKLKHVVGEVELRALGPKGRLVNVGRGDLVDTSALIAALEAGTIYGAGLDVVEGEPAVSSRLAVLGNLAITPHIGGATWGARSRGARIAEDEVLAEVGNLVTV
ncbi:NAD(P)-dependent oxidoreductase [Aureimonas sp. AU22]|uniref:NAD(P)-dependent oxidoreductase n=1 Tax=Aureimonas sp. AU22 TaxID=1638162 RepID=UPI001FCDBACC|nr:NAD(P)-dependent oxidoreductase [Aureimonas sp. AU22]